MITLIVPDYEVTRILELHLRCGWRLVTMDPWAKPAHPAAMVNLTLRR